jgi:hypothetical protein
MPSRALLTEAQTISAAEVTQALANQGIARASLSTAVTRTSATGTTLTNTGLTALTVTLAASTRYRLTYRLYLDGVNGFKIAFNFPSALATFDGKLLTYDAYNDDSTTIIVPDWPTQYGASGSTMIEAANYATQYGGLEFVADILTGSTINTFGDFSVFFAQYASGATASTMSKNSCVEVLKFP